MKDIARELLEVAREIVGGQGLTREQIDEVKGELVSNKSANVGDVEVIEPVGEGVSKTKQTKRMTTPKAASGGSVRRRMRSSSLKIDRSSRPARMKRPKVTTEKGAYRLYIQDLLWDVLVDKYGEARGQKQFDYFINEAPSRAMYPAGQTITDEKAQMYVDLGEMPPRDYFKESYFDVWKRWMKRPKV